MLRKIKEIKNIYDNISIQIKASVWYVICSILQRGISLMTVPIFTRIMSAEQYGYYTTYLAWYDLLLVFSSLNLFYGVFNNAMIKFKDDRDKYISSMQGLIAITTGTLFLVYLIFQDRANLFLGMPTSLVALLFVELFVTPALQFWSAHNRFEYKYKRIVLVTLAKSLLNPCLGIILVLNSDDKDIARIISMVATEVIFCGTIIIYQFVKGKRLFVKEYWKYALAFNLPLLPHYLSGQLLNQSDRIMISQMVNNSAVAMYSVAYSVGLLMNLFANAINGSYTPWFYQSIEKNNIKNVHKVSNLLMLLIMVMTSFLMLFGPEVMKIIAAIEYAEAVYIIPPISASVFFMFLYNMFANIEFYFDQTKYVLLGSICSAVLNLFLNAFFIPIFGYCAAAYTTLICYIIYAFMHYHFAMLVCKRKDIPKNIFSQRMIILLSIVITVITLFMNILYGNYTIRFGIIAVFIGIAVIYRKKLACVAKAFIQDRKVIK